MFHTTSFTRTAWTSLVVSGLLAMIFLSGCQHSRMHCGCAPAYTPPATADCGCGTAVSEPSAEPACLPAPQPAQRMVRWPADTSKMPGCTSGCDSCKETGCNTCTAPHKPRSLFAKRRHEVLPHPCCSRCNGPDCCTMCNTGGGSHLPMPGTELHECPRCHYRVSCRRILLCQTPDGRVNGCEVFQERGANAAQPPAVVPDPPSGEESAMPDFLPDLEDSVPVLEPVLPDIQPAATARKSPVTTKKPAAASKPVPKSTPEPAPETGIRYQTHSTIPMAPPLDMEEDPLAPLPPMQEVNILESDLDILPEVPELPDELELPAELDPGILPVEMPNDYDFLPDLPKDARPEKPFIDSVSRPKRGEEKTILRQTPEISEKDRGVPLTSRAPGTARHVQYTTAKPTITVSTFHHPLNEVKSTNKSDTSRRDDMVRPIVFQEPVAQPRSRMDADALAEAAAESERAADEARKQRFSDVPPPARRHNVYPHDEYIIDTTQLARIQELKPKRVPAGEIADNSWEVKAHDAEGTFIHFSTPSGRSSIQTTDPVYIYSPRFRAVRQVIDPTLSGQVAKIGDINTPMTAEVQQRAVGAERTTQRNQAVSETGRQQAVRMGSITYGGEISEATILREVEQDQILPQVAKLETTMGYLDTSDSPQVQKETTGANIWTSTEQMLVFVDHSRAAATVMVQNSPSLFVVEEKEEKPRVKIYKVASSDAAKSGETVTFTIRFENAGNTPISNIVIADNLAARLALDTESSESSVDVMFTSEPNANGSSLLRWEVTEPLRPGEWGVVRFNCVVR